MSGIQSCRILVIEKNDSIADFTCDVSTMGRYAFFNTGLEYKFCFGLQTSRDILSFGGYYNMKHDDPQIEWDVEEELEGILEKLREIEAVTQWPKLDFDKFSKNCDGTEELRSYLWEQEDAVRGIPKDKVRYHLGCLIYHQLLYTPQLSAHFDL